MIFKIFSSFKEKLITRIIRQKNIRLKITIVGILHILKKRYYGVYIDPILSCNFRCKMCYFSDPQKAKKMQGALSKEECQNIAQSLFPKALKLQVGCGAEPTLSKEFIHLIQLGKEYKIPYISMITNGNLIKENILEELCLAGLNELALSLHGTTKNTYEFFMQGGKFENFISLLENLKSIYKSFPNLKVRLNYTLNTDNLEDLKLLPELVRGFPIHIIQIRPIQKIGNSSYNNFSMQYLASKYNSIIEPVVKDLEAQGILVLCPNKNKLIETEVPPSSLEKFFEEITYYYVSPQSIKNSNEDFCNLSFQDYSKKNKLNFKIWSKIFQKNKYLDKKGEYTTKKINY